MTSSRKYDIPEELRSANLEYQRLLKEGLPVPDDVAAKNREYSRMCRRERGVQPRRRKHDIPEDVRKAASEYQRRRRTGEPVPDWARAGWNEYQWLLRQARGTKPRRLKYDIPEDIREAADEYRRLSNAGEPVPDWARAGWNEYKRLLRRARGTKPRRLKYDIPEDVRKAADEYRRLHKAGEPAPDWVLAGWNEYNRLLRRARGVKPPPRRTDIPEELRKAMLEYRRLSKAGEPVPEDVMDGYQKCQRLYNGYADGPRGRRPERTDIPERLRAAVRECSRLRRRGLPISDDLRELAKQYEQAAKRGRKPGDGGPRGRRPVHQGIPARLRQANNKYQQLRQKGEPVPEEVRKAKGEYDKMRRKARLEGRA